ncbi:MAG: RNA polymerase factor sigma-54 [Candidatus Margulisiibacteriota bacterium]
MFDLSLQVNLNQTLDLLLSPRLLQMLKVLNLPYIDLVEKIDQASEENVMLEVEKHDQYIEFIRYLSSDKKIKKEADFSELPGLENLQAKSETLEEHLLEQLRLEDLPELQHNLAQKIIENLDDFGYVVAYPRLREDLMQEFDISRPTVDKALKIVQDFEPEGVGARDLKECLLIQVEAYNFENESLYNFIKEAVDKHLEDLGKQDYAAVARAFGIPENGVTEIANFIKNNLNPEPGSAFGREARPVIPSFAVEKKGKEFKLVNLESHYGPTITLSPSYLKMLDNPKTDAKTREFLKEKLMSAKQLIEDIQKRHETLEKIVRKIMETQEEFLQKGITWLRPLAQSHLAEEFGLHPSTISRTVAEKYIQTPQGLFPLKFLCPRGPRGMTVARTKVMLTEIIKNEDKNQPLSDSQITERMQEMGSRIDRRTVAYYRKEMGIPTAEQRQAK